MKRIDGKTYRRFRGWTGKTYWIEMSQEEVLEKVTYNILLVLTPLATVFLMAWAAGMLN